MLSWGAATMLHYEPVASNRVVIFDHILKLFEDELFVMFVKACKMSGRKGVAAGAGLPRAGVMATPAGL